jgi:hypothetical protein
MAAALAPETETLCHPHEDERVKVLVKGSIGRVASVRIPGAHFLARSSLSSNGPSSPSRVVMRNLVHRVRAHASLARPLYCSGSTTRSPPNRLKSRSVE